MSTVAEQLRLAREAKNLSITQVADITKIRSDHLRALEEGNFNVFSAPVYIKGFVRTYAMLLKLDVAGVMRALDGEAGPDGQVQRAAPARRAKARRAGLPYPATFEAELAGGGGFVWGCAAAGIMFGADPHLASPAQQRSARESRAGSLSTGPIRRDRAAADQCATSLRSKGNLTGDNGVGAKSLFGNYEGCCGEGFWLWPRRRGCFRTGTSIPAAGCDDRANAGRRQKTRRP